MKKTVKAFRIAQVKKVTDLVTRSLSKKASLLEKMEKLQAELNQAQLEIDAFQGPIKAEFFGLSTEDLVKKTFVPAYNEDGSPKIDTKTGKQALKVQFDFNPKYLNPIADSSDWLLTVDEEEETDSQPVNPTAVAQVQEPSAPVNNEPEQEEESFDEENPFA